MTAITGNLAAAVNERMIALVVIAEPPRPDSGDDPVEVGSLALRVVASLRGDAPRAGDAITVGYERMRAPGARQRGGANQWNVLALEPGRSLVLALRPTAEPARYEASAGFGVEGPDDPLVADVLVACAIERDDDAAARADALQRALLGDVALRDYALGVIARRGGIARPVAVALLGNALAMPGGLDDRARVDVAFALLSPILFARHGGGDAVNRAIIELMAQGIAHDPDPDVQTVWIDALASLVLPARSRDPAADAAARVALVRAVPAELAEAVAVVLAAREAAQPARESTRELRQVWTAALGA